MAEEEDKPILGYVFWTSSSMHKWPLLMPIVVAVPWSSCRWYSDIRVEICWFVFGRNLVRMATVRQRAITTSTLRLSLASSASIRHTGNDASACGPDLLAVLKKVSFHVVFL